jgi:hypothetical protein
MIEVQNNQLLQDALERLRKTLGFSRDVDAWVLVSNATVRIERLQEERDGTWNSKETQKRLASTKKNSKVGTL